MTRLKIPWVPEDIFFLLILRREATRRCKALRGKNNLWSQELRVSFWREVPREKITSGHRSYESHFHAVWRWCACLFSLALTAEIWLYETLCLRCMKKELRKGLLGKESAIKNKIVTNSFPKKIHFKFQVYIKDRSQLRSAHSVCF